MSDQIDGRIERGDKTAEALLKAARSSFVKHGYDGASVRDIAKKAHINPALIRYHFGSKSDLYDRVVRDAISRLTQCLRAAAAETSALPIHQRFLEAYLNFLDEDEDFQRLLLRALLDGEARLLNAAMKELGPVLLQASEGLSLLGESRKTALFDAVVSLLGAAMVPQLYGPILEPMTKVEWRTETARVRRVAHLTTLANALFSGMTRSRGK
jgi:AcrR family transcriptional regulator